MKKRLGRLTLLTAVLAGVLLCVGWINCEISYTIQADNSNLADQAALFLQHGEGEPPASSEIQIYDSVSLGKEKYVLMELFQAGEPYLGMICLEQGLNGQYKIDHIGYGGGNFRERVVESGGEKYLLFGGRNTYYGICRVEVALRGRTYAMEVPEGERFLVCTAIDPAIEDTHSDWNELCFYNAGGEDITAVVLT